MTAITLAALGLLVLSPVIGFLLYAGSLLLAVRWLRIGNLRLRSALWIALRIIAADVVLAFLFHIAAMDSFWWSFIGAWAVFALFLRLVRKYHPTTLGRALGAYAVTFALGIVGILGVVLFVVVPLRYFVASPFEMQGDSMLPTLRPDDLVMVDKLTLRMREPRRGDVVVLSPPHQPDQYYVKRVVGLPGETVKFSRGEVVIDSEQRSEGSTLSEPDLLEATGSEASGGQSFYVPVGSYFVLGDNRDASSDSRSWGALPRANIVGIVSLRIWPPPSRERRSHSSGMRTWSRRVFRITWASASQ